MTFAEFLLKTTNEYNQHKQTEVKGLPLEEAIALCKELEELTNKESSFVIELWTCGSYSILEKDYFPFDHKGGRDRLILGVDNR